MTTPVRLGLVGAGRWGRVLLENIRRHPDTSLSWVASRNAETPALAGPGITVVPDWRAFADADLDGLVVATPAPTHAAIVLAAIEAGVPVLIEKPLCTSSAEARAILAAAEARGAVVLVDHTHVFHPGFPSLAHAVRRAGGPEWIATCGGQHGRRGGDVGALWDYGPHDLALALALLGDAAELTGAERTAAAEDGALEVLRLTLTSGGATADLCFGNALAEKQRWIAVGTPHGVYLLDDLAAQPLTRHPASPAPGRPQGPGEPLEVEAGMPVERLLTEFVERIRGRRQPPGDLASAVRVVELLEEAERLLRF
ncbi:MAG: Gfo/Idh/MocA family protein [Dehalococcoidia bacterium]